MDSLPTSVTSLNINKAIDERYIYGKDDDGLLRGNITGNKFVVFADEPPLKPDVYTAGLISGNVTFYWSKKDAKDLDLTEYKIIIKRDVNPTDNDSVLVDFKPGTQYTVSDLPAYDFKTTLPIVPPVSQHGQYKYQVIARDARLSTSRSDVANFPY